VIEEVVGDKGYHAAATLAACAAVGLRTYIPERDCGRRRWHDKPAAWELAVRNNRGGSAVRAVAGCNGCDPSAANGASRTPAGAGTNGGRGYAAVRTCRSATS